MGGPQSLEGLDVRHGRYRPLPIFRSGAQSRVLGHLFVSGAEGPWSLTEISERTGVPLSTVQREIQNLDRAGLVVSQRIGNTRLVSPNPDSPYYADLHSLLTKALGPVSVLAGLLRQVPGVERAFLFGSWAKRYAGEIGNAPRDIDVLIVGKPAMRLVYRAARDAESQLGLEVNPVVVTPPEFAKPRGLVKRVLDDAIVELDLRGD